MAPDFVTDLQPKPLSGLHLLLTCECNYECDHCFVCGGPSQSGTMSVETIEHILGEAMALGSTATGNLHICQGISIGNLLECPLAKIMSDYDPDDHPIIGPLLVGGEGGMDSNRLKAILTPAGRLRRLKCSGSHITV